MLIYRDQCSPVDPRAFLIQIQRQVDSLALSGERLHDAVVAATIDLGAIEAALADALNHDCDGVHPVTAALRRASHSAGHLLWHSWHSQIEAVSQWRMQLAAAIEQILALRLPDVGDLRVAEGYAQYGLFPEMYLEAARQFTRRVRPGQVVCIGIRSIGTSLSGIVAATLEEMGYRVESHTVRPRGHPYQRYLVLSPELENAVRGGGGSHFLLVDEGPGISGSSFAAAAEALNRIGVPNDRIVLFPSRLTDGQDLRSEAARRRWAQHQQFAATFEATWLDSGRLFRSREPFIDFSAGRWRERAILELCRYPAVHPQHERRKFLTGSTLLSFAGLGRYAEGKLDRSWDLAERGFAPSPLGIEHGFLEREFVAGEPLALGHRDGVPLELMAAYLAHLRRCYPAGASRRAKLREMMESNVAEALGSWGARSLQARLKQWGEQEDEQPTALDGRMLVQEWIRTPDGHIKVDVVDHSDDHFFPGHQDIAWDVAGTCLEFNLDREQRHELISKYRSASLDSQINRRLHFFASAYLAYRLGYAMMAEASLNGTADGLRFRSEVRRYREGLMLELASSEGSRWDV